MLDKFKNWYNSRKKNIHWMNEENQKKNKVNTKTVIQSPKMPKFNFDMCCVMNIEYITIWTNHKIYVELNKIYIIFMLTNFFLTDVQNYTFNRRAGMHTWMQANGWNICWENIKKNTLSFLLYTQIILSNVSHLWN